MLGISVNRCKFIKVYLVAINLGLSIKPGTWNIPEHPWTSNNYDNYEKKCVKWNFVLARMTIWSARIGHVTLRFFSRAEQLCFEMNEYGRTFHRVKSIEKYMKSLIIDDILTGGGNVSTEYYLRTFRAIGSNYKVSSVTSFKRMEDLLSNERKFPSPCCS